MTHIATPEQCIDYAKRMFSFSTSDTFKPFDITTSLDKKRSLPQNAYYHGVVIAEQLNHFVANPMDFIEWIVAAIKGSSDKRGLIHVANKSIFNNGKSTTTLKTHNFVEHFANPIRHSMLHDCGVVIPLPDDRELLEHFNKIEGVSA